MDERVAKLKSPEDCERFAKNALDRDRQDLADQAKKKAVELRAAVFGAKTEAERQCLEAICAHEEVLTAQNGRRTPASRTQKMLEKYGIVGAVERAVNGKTETAEYAALLKMGLQDYAFEAVVVRHPTLFSANVLARSRDRVDGWKVAETAPQQG
jgi:hypothetical protein